MTMPNLWDAAKVVLEGQFVAVKYMLEKTKGPQPHQLSGEMKSKTTVRYTSHSPEFLK